LTLSISFGIQLRASLLFAIFFFFRFLKKTKTKMSSTNQIRVLSDDEKKAGTEKELSKLLESEHEYIGKLEIMIERFLKPLRLKENAKVVPRNALATLFYNVELLYSLNVDLCKRLQKAFDDELDRQAESMLQLEESDDNDDNNDEKNSLLYAVAATFLSIAAQLQSYRQYIDNFDDAEALHDKLVREKRFSEFVAKQLSSDASADAQICSASDLLSLLREPTVRVRSYAISLRRLMKFVDAGEPGHQKLNDAALLLAGLNAHLTESRTNSEHVHKLRDIQKRVSGLDNSFATIGRRVVREGWLEKMNPKGKVQRRLFILVSDMLIWAAPKGMGSGSSTKLSVRGSCPINVALVKDLEHQERAFQVVRMDVAKNYHLIAPDASVKARWVDDLRKLVDSACGVGASLSPASSASPQPQQHDSADMSSVSPMQTRSRPPSSLSSIAPPGSSASSSYSSLPALDHVADNYGGGGGGSAPSSRLTVDKLSSSKSSKSSKSSNRGSLRLTKKKNRSSGFFSGVGGDSADHHHHGSGIGLEPRRVRSISAKRSSGYRSSASFRSPPPLITDVTIPSDAMALFQQLIDAATHQLPEQHSALYSRLESLDRRIQKLT
jgi:RhoGEF domain